ncbi:autophagy protein 5 isoform X2 [Jatropha curcas]|uniref:autophagy protein 5 isoform X2 n=1 Tax=Jatropha curcas TaxID=180498 RepID=UPI0009D7906D|nr:autophagy protein 5 isoform X2 [Jatropha curcas]
MDAEAQKYVWEGAIPLQVHLHESEVTTLPPPPPAHILAPRVGYLPLLISLIKPHFASSLPPGVDTVWFDYNGLPLKWYIPTGVLFDLLCAEPERPWNLTVHFRGYPSNLLIPCEGEDSVKWSFINSLKEADYIINGNCKNVMNMSQSDQVELWRSVINGNLEAYLRASSKLKLGMVEDEFTLKMDSLSPKSQKTMVEADTAGQMKIGKIPVRLYIWSVTGDFQYLEDIPKIDSWDKISYINRPVEIRREEGKYFTLHDALKTLIPEFLVGKSVIDNVSFGVEDEDEQKVSSKEVSSNKLSCPSAEPSCESGTAEIKLVRIQGSTIFHSLSFFALAIRAG